MKLTKFDKECFVSSVMNDVPKIDYDSQASSLCKAWAIERLPAEVAIVYKQFPGWIENKGINTPSGLSTVYAPLIERIWNTSDDQPDLWAHLKVLGAAAGAQYEARKALTAQVEAVIAGCSTLKQAKDRLPEFEKYLPLDRDGSTTLNLPVTANLVTELVGAGWPKAANKETLVEAA